MNRFNDYETWLDIRVSDALHEVVNLECPYCDGDGDIVTYCDCCDAEKEEECEFCDGTGEVSPEQIDKSGKWKEAFTLYKYIHDLEHHVDLLAKAKGVSTEDILKDSNLVTADIVVPTTTGDKIETIIKGVKQC